MDIGQPLLRSVGVPACPAGDSSHHRRAAIHNCWWPGGENRFARDCCRMSFGMRSVAVCLTRCWHAHGGRGRAPALRPCWHRTWRCRVERRAHLQTSAQAVHRHGFRRGNLPRRPSLGDADPDLRRPGCGALPGKWAALSHRALCAQAAGVRGLPRQHQSVKVSPRSREACSMQAA